MNKAFGNDDPALARYIHDVYAPEDPQLREIRERATAAGLPGIQVAALDARHLEVLVRMTGVRKAVEIGTLAGYSGVSIVRGMLPDGILYHDRVRPPSCRRRRRELPAGWVQRSGAAVAGAGAGGAARAVGRGAVRLLFHRRRQGKLRPVPGLGGGQPAQGWGGGRRQRLPVRWAAHRREPRRGSGRCGRFTSAWPTSGEFRSTVLPTGEGLAVGVRI